MYGVPADLDLSFLLGAELTQICIGAYQLQFHFHPEGQLSVEGAWEFRGPSGSVIDRSADGPAAERAPFELHRLLGRAVCATEVSAPSWLAVRFGGGFELRLFDGPEPYESIQIHPGGIVI